MLSKGSIFSKMDKKCLIFLGSEKVSLHFIPPEADSKTTSDSSLTAESSPSDLISTLDLSPSFKSKSTADSCSISFPVPPVPESEIQVNLIITNFFESFTMNLNIKFSKKILQFAFIN